MKKSTLLAMLIAVCVIFSCQQEDDLLIENQKTENSLKKVNHKKLIDYKGLKVNHRFSTDLNNKSQLRAPQNKNKYYSNPQRIIAVTELILDKFPYNLDSNFSQSDMTMIRNDFPLLSDNEIVSQMDIIEEYYGINLLNEYKLKYDELYGGKEIFDLQFLRSGVTDFQIDCILGFAGYKNNPVKEYKAKYAISKADGIGEAFAIQEYGYLHKYDTKRDAFRHMMWNAMLAQYYFTVTRKSPRVKFAKAFTDAWELSHCKDKNLTSGMNMDLHNNNIGRAVWNSEAKSGSFFGFIGLSKPTRQKLTNRFKSKIGTSKFIDRSTIGDSLTVAEINTTPKNVVVYIKKPSRTYNLGDIITFKPSTSEFHMIFDPSDGNFSNGNIPREYFIESIDNLGIKVGDKLNAFMRYKGSSVIYDNGSNGLDAIESITITYRGEATVFESLGNNKFLIGFTDYNGWNTTSTNQDNDIRNWQIDYYETDYYAKYTIK